MEEHFGVVYLSGVVRLEFRVSCLLSKWLPTALYSQFHDVHSSLPSVFSCFYCVPFYRLALDFGNVNLVWPQFHRVVKDGLEFLTLLPLLLKY